jgi:Mg-chelatase subunit ChlD
MGRTDLASVLQDAIDSYLGRKAQGSAKANGETILVITDGEPDDRRAVMKQIIETSRKLDRDDELAISLIQVGSDRQATEFLKALDDQLQGAGAKFDIVDTITIDDMEDLTLAEVLLNAITD